MWVEGIEEDSLGVILRELENRICLFWPVGYFIFLFRFSLAVPYQTNFSFPQVIRKSTAVFSVEQYSFPMLMSR